MALGYKTGGRQKGTLNRQTHAEKAAFALEAAALLDAEGIDVLADLTAAYLADRKPMFHRQRYGYTMMRHLDRARTAQAIAARQAREAQARGEPQPVLVPPAPGKRELLDPVAFLSEALDEAGRELQQAAGEGVESQAWQSACHYLARVQAQIERLPCQDSALASELAGRIAQSRALAARLTPPAETMGAAECPTPVTALAPRSRDSGQDGETPPPRGIGEDGLPRDDHHGMIDQPIEMPSCIITKPDGVSINRENCAPPGWAPRHVPQTPREPAREAQPDRRTAPASLPAATQGSRYPSTAGVRP